MGLLQREAFLEELDHWVAKSDEQFLLIYITIDNYNYFVQMGTTAQKNKLQEHILDCFRGYIKSEHITARVGECNFAVAIKENMSAKEMEGVEKELMIELIWSFIHDGEKLFLTAQYSGCQFPRDAETSEALLRRVIQSHQARMAAKNPARDIADKCEQMLAGKDDILFGEYADMEMNRLAKVLTRYRKSVRTNSQENERKGSNE